MNEWTFPFGSHKGKTLEHVYKVDPSYLMWARDELKDDEIRKRIRKFIQQKNMEIIEKGKRP